MTDDIFREAKLVLGHIEHAFPHSPGDTAEEHRHRVTLTPNGHIELEIWFLGERWRWLLKDETVPSEIPGLMDQIKAHFREQRYLRSVPKAFKIVAVSQNPNSFGLHGHILLAPTGECWEVARHRTGPHEGEWNMGDIVVIAKRSAAVDDYAWAENSCEIPERRPDAPEQIVDEVFRRSNFDAVFPSKLKPSIQTK